MAMLSRPVYGKLSAQAGTHHLFIADAEGASAILAMAKQARQDFFASAEIMYIPGSAGNKYVVSLEALVPGRFYQGPSIAAAMPRLRHIFENAHMGLRLYLTGTEGLIGQVSQIAADAGIEHSAIQTEHRGSLARRVQCVHCKGITENVTTQPVRCSHCGLLLLVRDHYSRRHAAFQGVCINAEDPSENPPAEEIFR